MVLLCGIRHYRHLVNRKLQVAQLGLLGVVF